MHKVLLYGICFLILTFCPLVTGYSYASTKMAVTEEIKPPDWALGSWGNLYESNADKIVYFVFEKNNITYRLGAGINSQIENWNTKYIGYKATQTYDGNTYKISFVKGNSQISYEFKFRKADSTHSESMTYAITDNNNYIVKHSTSARTLLLRM